jgi:apolipoprotein N-acyltransferase
MGKLNLNNQSGRWAVRGVLCASIVLSAWLMWLSMAGHVGPWAGWISLAPLLVAIRLARPLQAACYGAAWGLSLFLVSVCYGAPVAPPTVKALGLLVCAPASYALLGSAITRTRLGFSPLLLATGWVGVEYALAPVTFGLGLLAGGLIRGTCLQAIAGVLGYGVIAFAVAYANGLLLRLLAEVRVSVPGPLFAPGATDPGARLFPEAASCITFRGVSAARPRAPPRD